MKIRQCLYVKNSDKAVEMISFIPDGLRVKLLSLKKC